MAGPAHDAGVQVACPRCHEMVLQKAMIPILAQGGPGIGYLCPPCARALIVLPAVPAAGGAGTETEPETEERAASS